jgi:16S rRNA C967 or C1407 C5-methylase (RsmB/RsmF family)/NOL1/NOP2/fmu family ribosome biogenesis protein
MQAQLGEAWPDFQNALLMPAPVSIRFHFLKNNSSWENFEKVKWINNGVYLPERPVFTLDPAFHAGAYYVQEAASMLTAAALGHFFPHTSSLRVLDLAAAPGGKSTLLIERLAPDSLLVANEVIRSRFHTLAYNMIKWGYPNGATTNHDSSEFKALENWFDLVLLDAPCSGEGLFRKDPDAMSEWSPENVKHCAARQKRILADAARLLKPGGILLYSTCTYNPQENDDNMTWMAKEYGMETLRPEFPEIWGTLPTKTGIQCYPHKVKGEGFFLAALQKTGPGRTTSKVPVKKPSNQDALPTKYLPLIRPLLKDPDRYAFFIDARQNVHAVPVEVENPAAHIAALLPRCHYGLEIGQLKGKDLVPSPALALSTAIAPDLPGIDLDRTTALRYLKKDTVEMPGTPQGWTLARFQGLNLGWAKVLPGRVNNYYPREWRILMQIP